MKFSEFLEEMGYKLTEYQMEMVDLFQKEVFCCKYLAKMVKRHY